MITLKDVFLFSYSMCIYITAIIVGFLLPKSKGNLNEMVSTIFLMMIIILITLPMNISWAIYPVISR